MRGLNLVPMGADNEGDAVAERAIDRIDRFSVSRL